MKRVINIVEDEKDINNLMVQYFRKEDYEVNSFYTYEDASAHTKDDDVHLWILDIMLDDKSRFDLLEDIRTANPDTPVIFMSARDQEFARRIAMEKGCDDYITTPFSPRELVLRVNNIIKRISMKRVINIVEGEKDVNNLMAQYLRKGDYKVNSFYTYEDASAHTKDDDVHLWILDIMLDDKSGFDLLKDIRTANPDTPVIFISDRDQEFDRIIALEKGADDYIAKPFSPKELVLRVNNIIKRAYRDTKIQISTERVINIVEDEKDINNLVAQYFRKEGYKVNSFYTYKDASTHTKDDDVYLWILDIILDDKSGFDLLEDIRSANPETPVIFMSARDHEFDRRIGLEKGADDYITKPFSPKELVLRVNNIIKRTYRETNKRISMGRVINIVDDHKDINNLVAQYFRKEGYEVNSFYTYEDASTHTKDDDVHLWILDIILGDKSGFDLLEDIRSANPETPVIFMSDRAYEFDRRIGLEIGGDDYITKPFSPKELVLRANNIIKRVYRETKIQISTERVINIVEDEKDINNLVAEYLRKGDYEVNSFYTYEDASVHTKDDDVHLWILDNTSDDESGFDLLEDIRTANPEIPVILLSARAQEFDRRIGLEKGCDDYITKPFSPKELVLRVNNIIKRAYRETNDQISIDGYELDEK